MDRKDENNTPINLDIEAKNKKGRRGIAGGEEPSAEGTFGI